MSGTRVTIGRWVHYRLTEDDVTAARLARTQVYYRQRGPEPQIGDVLPALVVAVDEHDIERVDLQVFGRGAFTLFVDAVGGGPNGETGELTGRWFWPPRV